MVAPHYLAGDDEAEPDDEADVVLLMRKMVVTAKHCTDETVRKTKKSRMNEPNRLGPLDK